MNPHLFVALMLILTAMLILSAWSLYAFRHDWERGTPGDISDALTCLLAAAAQVILILCV